MTAPVIAVLDNDPSFLSLMHDLLTEEGYLPLLWHAPALPDPHAFLLRAMRCAVLRRPFDLKKLLNAIAAVLGGSRAHRERTPMWAVIPSAALSMTDLTDNPLATAAGVAVTNNPPIPPPGGDAEERGGAMTVADERIFQSAYITDGGRHFRALYNPNVSDPRWFIRSFVVGADGAPGEIQEYPGRFADEAAAWAR